MATNRQRLVECGVGIAAVTAGCAYGWGASVALIVFGFILLIPMLADVARSLRRGPE